jgi:hypothetical protein
VGKKAEGYQCLAEEMTIVHNFMLRFINSIYLQAENVEKRGNPQDIDDFVNYAVQWSELLEEHHKGEEADMFPQIEELAGVPGLMTNNVQQHEAFHPGLEAYETYLRNVLAGKEKYEGARLKGIIDSFMPILRQHLSDEIDTLIELKKHDTVDWGKWYTKFIAEIMAKTKDPDIKVRRLGCSPLILTTFVTEQPD